MTVQKRALFIAYSFPPMGGIAVQRPLKFVKYMQEFGWNPVVLTTRDAYSATMDASLLDEIPQEVQLCRVADPLSRLLSRFASPQAAKGATVSEHDHTLARRSVLRSFKNALRSVLKVCKQELFVPDEHILWSLKAAWRGIRLVRQQRIQCIYTTSGPNSTHIAGYIISRVTGVKWVADFRDPWVDNLHYVHRGLRDVLERFWERRVFHRASAIVTVTDSFKDTFRASYPSLENKIRVIRNGVDPADFPPPTPPPAGGPLTLFYAGILYPKRSPARLFQALSIVLRYSGVKRSDILMQFAGIFDFPGQTANQDMVDQLGLGDIVSVLGYLPRTDVLARMQDADALVLIGECGQKAKQYVPGKLYEYLFANRPIVALMEDGEAANIVRSAHAGAVVPPSDAWAIAEAIVALVKAKRANAVNYAPNWDQIQTYNRVHQTKQLQELFDTLTTEHRPVVQAKAPYLEL